MGWGLGGGVRSWLEPKKKRERGSVVGKADARCYERWGKCQTNGGKEVLEAANGRGGKGQESETTKTGADDAVKGVRTSRGGKKTMKRLARLQPQEKATDSNNN